MPGPAEGRILAEEAKAVSEAPTSATRKPDSAAPAATQAAAKADAPAAERVEQVSLMFVALDKLVRGTRLYEGRGALVQRLLDELVRRVEAVVQEGELTVRVTPFGLLLGGEPVTQPETRLTEFLFRFFCDGIRELTISPGIEADEIRSLIDVLISDPRKGEEDYATLLWKRELQHVHFYATDTLQTGFDLDREEDQGLLAASRHSRVDNAAGGLAEEIVLSPDDLRMLKTEEGLRWIGECAAPMRVGEVQAETLAAVQQAFESPWDHARFLQMAVRAGEARPSEPSPLVLGMFDSLLASADAEGVGKLLSASAEAARMGGLAAKSLRRALFDPARVAALAPLHERQADVLAAPLQEAVADFPDSLVDLLNHLQPGAGRDSLRAALRDAGVDLTAHYARCLEDSDEAVVQDAVAVLAKIGSPPAIQALAAALGYTSTAVRRGALRAMVGHYPETARVSLARALGDPDRECRMLALRILRESQDRRIAGNILSRIQDATFSGRDEEEQTAFLGALASFHDPRTVAYFSSLLNEMKLSRGPSGQARLLLAVEALAGIEGEEARKALNRGAGRWSLPRAVKKAARAALARSGS